MHRYCWRGLWFVDIRDNDMGYNSNINNLLK